MPPTTGPIGNGNAVGDVMMADSEDENDDCIGSDSAKADEVDNVDSVSTANENVIVEGEDVMGDAFEDTDVDVLMTADVEGDIGLGVVVNAGGV